MKTPLRFALILLALAALPACRTPEASTTKGGISSIGLPGPVWLYADNGIFVQEYWLNGEPHYLLANARAKAAIVTAKERTGDDGAPAYGPWTVPAGGVIDEDVTALVREIDQGGEVPAFGFTLSDGTSIGSMPAPTKAPGDTTGQRFYYQGLNNIGPAFGWAGISASVEPRAFVRGGQGHLHLQMADHAGDVTFNIDDSKEAPQLASVRVVAVTAPTLAVHKSGNVITVKNPGEGAGQDSTGPVHDVDILFEIPATAAGSMAELHARVSISTWYTNLSYGLELAP